MINISYSDIERWLDEKRFDIIREVKFVTFKIVKKRGFYFYKTIPYNHPPCPFFDKNNIKCTIYETRPLACRDYPLGSISAIKCPNNPFISKKIKSTVISNQYKDFKKAHISRKKICELLSIVNHYPISYLEEKWGEIFGYS